MWYTKTIIQQANYKARGGEWRSEPLLPRIFMCAVCPTKRK
jgi:hypothetical protein